MSKTICNHFTNTSQLYLNTSFLVYYGIMVLYFKNVNANIRKYTTILVLISMVTVTTGCTALQNLQDKATSVASGNIEDITNGLNIKSIEAIVGDDGRISLLYLRVTTKPGSGVVNLSEVMIHMSDGKKFFDLFYEPDNNVKTGYNVNLLIAKTKFYPEKPLIEKGDFAAITIDTLQNGIDLRSGDTLQISFDSAIGNKAVPLEIDLGDLRSGANSIY